MSDPSEKLKGELSRLSMQERAELAHFLIDSLDQEADADVAAAWDAELARRMEEIKSGEAMGESADAVFAYLREKYA
jgi:putative addiction module component (TIGR02574 family)